MSNSSFWENCETSQITLTCPRISGDGKMKSNQRQTYPQVQRQPPRFRHSNP